MRPAASSRKDIPKRENASRARSWSSLGHPEKGTTGWSGHFHSAAVAGFSPAGWLFSNIDSRCGVATAVLEVPAVADFPKDQDIFSLIQTGDWVEMDGSTGEVLVTKK